MRTKILIAVVVLSVASVVHAQKMVVDVDKTVDFNAFKTYAWDVGQVAPRASTGKMIITAIENELNSRGLVRNDEAPDMKIAVMAAAGMDLQGVGPSWNNERYKSWGGGAYGNPAALMNVARGTLLVDLIDTRNKHSVWRGVARDVFVAPSSGNPAKDEAEMTKVVNKTVGKMFKKYPVKLSK